MSNDKNIFINFGHLEGNNHTHLCTYNCSHTHKHKQLKKCELVQHNFFYRNRQTNELKYKIHNINEKKKKIENTKLIMYKSVKFMEIFEVR